MGEQVRSSRKYTEAQMKFIEEAIKAEQAFELRSAFNKGTKVVNVLTGKITIVK
jgi:hypothetical protein